MPAPELLKQRLLTAFPDAQVELFDLTGTQDHYECRIATEHFRGQSPLAQHKLVYTALGELLKGPVHAFSVKTYLPEKWSQRGPRS